MNTVMVNVTTIMKMTEMFQWPICLSKKWLKCFSKKTASSQSTYFCGTSNWLCA